MPSRLLPALALALTVALLPACAVFSTENPRAQMGPDSARYIGSRYRRTFVTTATAEAPSVGDPTGMTGPSGVALERAPRRGRSRGGPPQSVPIPPRSAPASVAQPTPTAHGVTTTAPERMSAGGTPRAEPGTTAATASAPSAATAPLTTPKESAARTKRRFLRLKIHGMESTDAEAPFAVRRMLSSAPGVKEVVLSSKTQTAIVVIEPDTDPDIVRATLEPPYRAELLQ